MNLFGDPLLRQYPYKDKNIASQKYYNLNKFKGDNLILLTPVKRLLQIHLVK